MLHYKIITYKDKTNLEQEKNTMFIDVDGVKLLPEESFA